MTNEQKLQLINELIKHKSDIDSFVDKFEDLFGSFTGNGECKYEVFVCLFDDYKKLVAKQIGCAEYDIDWFIGENECGRKRMRAVNVDRKLIVIDSAESFVKFVNDGSYVKYL